MSRTPHFKVYTRDGEYIGALKDATDAACMVALRGEGATVRYDHKHIVWREGAEDDWAGNSYDHAAGVIHERVAALFRAGSDRRAAAAAAYAARVQP